MIKNEFEKGEIIIYKTADKRVDVSVSLYQETVWLSLIELAQIFETDKSGISRHIKNIYQSGELDVGATVAKIATVRKEGEREVKRSIDYYNLDLILSVGYRVNSKRATQFRVWATKKLKEYLIRGYVVNEKRLLSAKEKLKELQSTISFLQEKSKHEFLAGQAEEILNLLSGYSKSLTLLEQYDANKVKISKKTKAGHKLKYDEAIKIVLELKKELTRKKEAGDLFGQLRGGGFEGIVRGLHQTFGGKELYGSVEEKAAHLLYLIIKDHPFADGNKRSAAFLFVYFLDKNNFLYRSSGEKKINDNALVALALLIAISDPRDKDLIIKIITNLLN